MTYVPKTHRIDHSSDILAGLRMEVTRATGRWGFHRSPELKARARKLEWAQTQTRPEGTDMWAADLDIVDSRVEIPSDAVQPYFVEKDAFLMLQVLATIEKDGGYFIAPAFFKKAEVYGLDLKGATNEKGQYRYSLPQHMGNTGDSRFFFLMRLKRTGPSGNVEFSVDKVTITRGKEHYSVVVKPYLTPKVAVLSHLVGICRQSEKLRDLPVEDLVRKYGELNPA